MVNAGQNWRLDCNKSRHSDAVLVPGRSIDAVSFCGWAPCHAEDALCEDTSCRMPSSRMGNFLVMASSFRASQSTLALATRIGWKPSALIDIPFLNLAGNLPRKRAHSSFRTVENVWITNYRILSQPSLISLLNGLYDRGTPAGREPDIEDIHHIDGSKPITETR